MFPGLLPYTRMQTETPVQVAYLDEKYDIIHRVTLGCISTNIQFWDVLVENPIIEKGNNVL